MRVATKSALLMIALSSLSNGVVLAADDTALRLANVSASNSAFVRVANSPAFSLQQFTLEAWVQRVGQGSGSRRDGLYFVRLRFEDRTVVRPVVLLR